MKQRCLLVFGAVAAVASVPLAGQARHAADSPAAPTTSWTERTAWGGSPTCRASGGTKCLCRLSVPTSLQEESF